MNNFKEFTNKYQVSKTLRFRLEPIGGTGELIRQAQIIESDERRSKEATKMKQILDNCHKQIIDSVLSAFSFDDCTLKEIFDTYTKSDAKRDDQLDKLQKSMRKSIVQKFNDKIGKIFDNFDKFVKYELSDYANNEDERKIISRFIGFVTYFSRFNTNRKYMYSDEAKSSSIAFRLVNQNLTKFMDNIIVYKKLSEELPKEILSKIYEDFKSIINTPSLDSFFAIENFNQTLTQKQIETYNAVIGGKTDKDKKINTKGLNQYVNEYNQSHDNTRLPKMMRLFNQILSDRDGISERPEPFKDAKETVNAVKDCFANEISKQITSLSAIVSKIETYDISKIYIKGGDDLKRLSNSVYGYYNYITDRIADKWKHDNPQGRKKPEKYAESLRKYLKGITSISIQEIISACGDNNVVDYFKNLGAEDTDNSQRENVVALTINKYNDASPILADSEITDDILRKNSNLIKDLLDAVKSAQRLFKLLCGSGAEVNKDHAFYDDYIPAFEALENSINPLYNKVRNYVTKKDFSTDKFKLNFECSYFLSGWSTNGKIAKGDASIFINDGQYYLGVNRCLSDEDIAYLEDAGAESGAKRAVYKFMPSAYRNIPRVFIQSKKNNIAPAVADYNLPVETVIDIYDKKLFDDKNENDPQKRKESLAKLIDYYKIGLSRHPSYSYFDIQLKKSDDYNTLKEFYDDLEKSCYTIVFTNVDWNKLMQFTEEGKFYLFRIANKDLTGNSTGLPNLHTIYWKMLFNEKNLRDVVYRLSGNAEIFMRYKSLKNPIVHKAGISIKNKCPFTEKDTSSFDYDIIKDRRYTKDQIELHVPVQMNFKSPAEDKLATLNAECRNFIKNNGIEHIIGIDRGERNLLYMVITDLEGNIIEQKSLNQISSNPKIPNFKQDYHTLLKQKADANAQARRDWMTINNIKDIKFGFLSQIVHEIAIAMVKYKAIVVLENLNCGFMQNRGLENNVYQKFEQMLLDKLSYFVDKTKQPEDVGGALHAYQLSNTYSYSQKQNASNQKPAVRQSGFVFYIPAWLTSKIDPVTGFASFLRFHRNDSMATIKSTVSKFDSIKYDKGCDIFRFCIDYDKFDTSSKSGKRKWVLSTYGDRILAQRSAQQNNNFVYQTVELTTEFKNLFASNNIDIYGNLKDAICKVEDAGFFRKLGQLLSLTLQLRNSNPETGKDYLISPIADDNGNFFDSRSCSDNLPKDADANGAYNIARKGLMIVEQLKDCEDVEKFKPSIKNEEWLNYVQHRK